MIYFTSLLYGWLFSTSRIQKFCFSLLETFLRMELLPDDAGRFVYTCRFAPMAITPMISDFPTIFADVKRTD